MESLIMQRLFSHGLCGQFLCVEIVKFCITFSSNVCLVSAANADAFCGLPHYTGIVSYELCGHSPWIVQP